jgi:hypothetical protein
MPTEISSLYRSFNPKYTNYSSDGKGRDGYISYNNGGFLGVGPKFSKTSDNFYSKFTPNYTGVK